MTSTCDSLPRFRSSVTETKECPRCEDTLEVTSSFHKRGVGWQTYCKDCTKEYNREHYQRQSLHDRKRRRLRQRYKLPMSVYSQMMEDQQGHCLLCHRHSEDRALVVDHCHDTGKVRGLICSQCNAGIGLLGDGRDPEIFDRAREYLTP